MKKVNLLECVLNGIDPPHTPVWLMRQAGRYLPEYRVLREKAGSFWALCNTPHWASEVTMMPVRRYGLDAAIVFSDILTVPQALGVAVRFSESGPVLSVPEDFSLFGEVTNAAALEPVCETLRLVRTQLDPYVSLFGFAGAPWTLASYIIAGRGGDDQVAARLFAYRYPETFRSMIDRLCDVIAQHLIAQLRAGANVVQIFDSWAGSVNAADFDDFILKPTQKIVDAVRAQIADAKIIGFPRGLRQDDYRSYANNSGVNAISLDTQVSMNWAADAIFIPIQGNLDPVALVAGGAALKRETHRILDAMQGHRFIFNLGHGVLQQTPPEHVEELVQIVRSYR